MNGRNLPRPVDDDTREYQWTEGYEPPEHLRLDEDPTDEDAERKARDFKEEMYRVPDESSDRDGDTVIIVTEEGNESNDQYISFEAGPFGDEVELSEWQ